MLPVPWCAAEYVFLLSISYPSYMAIEPVTFM